MEIALVEAGNRQDIDRAHDNVSIGNANRPIQWTKQGAAPRCIEEFVFVEKKNLLNSLLPF
jgi:hypothetical protein